MRRLRRPEAEAWASRPEDRFEVETPLGPVWFWGRDRGRPVLLLITGTFSEPHVLRGLRDVLPEIDVWRAHLPGNHCPPLAATSVGVYAAAYSQALAQRLPERPLVVLGLSVGALVALGLRASNIRRMLLVEPPLLTEGLWPLALLRKGAPPGAEEFLWNVLGVGPDRLEPRDYSALLDALQIPTRVMLGDELPGEPRDSDVLPSLVTPPARALLARHPHVRTTTVRGAGHNVPQAAGATFLDAVTVMGRRAFGGV